jgi:cell division ATPase FtsA
MSFSFLKIEESKYALSVHPPYGTSIYSSKIIEREDYRKEITESEIENAISQAIWKLFDEERMLFSKRLDVSEMDVVMADVRILYIKLDGGEVVNPVGFTAKAIEIGLAETLITRDLSENIKSSIPKNGKVVFTLEPTASCAWLIQKDSKKKEFAIARISDEKTFIYQSSNGEKISYISDFDWGVNHLVKSVSSKFGISENVARDVIRKYVREDMSADMIKGLKETISAPFSEFCRGVTVAVRNVKIKKPTLYIMNGDLSELDPKNISWKEAEAKMNFLPSIGHEEIAFHEM